MFGNTTCTAHFSNNFFVFITKEPRDSDNDVLVDPPLDWFSIDWPSISISGYEPGTIVTLEPVAVSTPLFDYYFDSWTGPDADECAKLEVEMIDHNINCTAVFTPALKPPAGFHRWMTENAPYIEDRRLMDVVLPGSHDAGTYSFGQSAEWVANEPGWDLPESLLPLIGKVRKQIAVGWSKTQPANIHWQLDAGMRYFDLRFFQVDDTLYIHHGQVRGTNNSDEILVQVRDFLDEEIEEGEEGHEQEIIILDLSRWKDVEGAHHREFLDELLKLFKDDMIPAAYEHAPLGKIWDLPGRPQLVVRYQGLQETWFTDDDEYLNTSVEDFQLFWPHYPVNNSDWFLCRPWANAQTVSALEADVIEEMNCPCCADGYNRSEQLFVLQGLLTPDKPGHMVKCGIRRAVADWFKDFDGFCKIPVVGSETCDTINGLLGLLACPSEDEWENAPQSIHELAIGPTTPGNATPRTIKWVSDWWKGCDNCTRDNVNIIGIDYLEASYFDVIRESINLNKAEDPYNDSPAFTALPDLDSEEGAVVQLSAGFTDEDDCDHHVASIDWGDGTGLAEAGVDKATSTIESSHVYADDGLYVVDVCVKDGPNPLPTIPFINEIHYDNDGDDIDERVEIAGAAGTDLSGWSIALYDSDRYRIENLPYHTESLDSAGTIPDSYDGYGMVTVPLPDIHNTPAGIALINERNEVSQFICYEGNLIADGGPAAKFTCNDIGVSETGYEPAGQSLQLSGKGTLYGDYLSNWNPPAAETFGKINPGQEFEPYWYNYSETCDSFQVHIKNVAPTVNAGSDMTIDESETFTLAPATFNDKGTLDEHTAAINWDDRRPPELSTIVVGAVIESPSGPPGKTGGANGTVAGSFTYGDNGLYNVEVCVTDDEATTCDQVAVTVNNKDPLVDFDKDGAELFAAGPAFLARRGVEQSFTSEASDVGSDDLTFDWTFPPSRHRSLTTYFNDTAAPDPAHSPNGNFPFIASDINKTTFNVPGVYEATIDIDDDDTGHASDSLPLLMTDSRRCTALRPTWDHQFGAGGKQTIDDRRLQGYLDIIRFASAYFDDGNLAVLADADAVFGDELLKQEALAAWLNFASGGVLWDQEIVHLGRPFQEVIRDIDAVLLDPAASKKVIGDARKDALEINTLRPDTASCNDAGSP